MFDDLIEMVNKPLGSNYHPMTDTEYHMSTLDDVIEYAEGIAGEWNGDNAGKLEDRANQALEIIEACQKVKMLLEGIES